VCRVDEIALQYPHPLHASLRHRGARISWIVAQRCAALHGIWSDVRACMVPKGRRREYQFATAGELVHIIRLLQVSGAPVPMFSMSAFETLQKL
jgi:hypothetical protein